MKLKRFYVEFDGGSWVLKQKGVVFPIKKEPTKAKIMDYAIKYVKRKGGSLKVRKLNGRWQEERTYPRSKDPKDRKG